MLPQRVTTTQGLSSDGSLLRLRQTQVLEDQHGIGGGKVNKLLGSLPGKGARPAALLASKPFEKPTNTACVLLLCGLDASNAAGRAPLDRKSTRLNSSHRTSSYAVFCLKKK